ncbi:isochorismatase family protein [Saccharopolyspora elongata]|nr:isochorismatase family protein [Saccharopolyspora elongata]
MKFLDIQDTVLLVIDMQPGFYPPGRRDVDRSALNVVFENAAWVVEVARGLSIPVVVAEEDPEKNGPTHHAIVESLPASSKIYPKTSFGVAGDPRIMEALDSLDRSTTVLVGTETDICVCHSALGLQEAGKRVAVVHDCVYSPKAAHDYGLQRMQAAGVELMSAKQLLYDWLPTLGQIREFRKERPQLSYPTHFSL